MHKIEKCIIEYSMWHTITTANGLGQSQSWGGISGPSVLVLQSPSSLWKRWMRTVILVKGGTQRSSIHGQCRVQCCDFVYNSFVTVFRCVWCRFVCLTMCRLHWWCKLNLVYCIFQYCLVQTPSSTSNDQSVPIDTILAVVFGSCVILLLLMMVVFLTWLLVSKKKGKECSQVVNEGPKPLRVSYENTGAAVSDNFQPSFAQNEEVRTADNVAYFTQL